MKPPESPFLHAYMVDGDRYFFHSLTLSLCDSAEDVPDIREDMELLDVYRQKVSTHAGVQMVCMFLTTACPRACSYCFLGGINRVSMTCGEIDRGLELAGDGPADLLLYGGEPFSQPDLVMHAIQSSKAAKARFNVSVATGGVPVSSSLATDLAEINAFIILSVDGPPSVQNRIRSLPGRDSFNEVEKAFHTFRDAGCRVGLSLTVSGKDIESTPENFQWLMERFRPDDMGLNPWLHPVGGLPNPCQTDSSRILDVVISCMEIAIRSGMYVEQLARRARPYATLTPRLKDCASAGARLVLVPGGIAGVCDCMTACDNHGVPISDARAVRDMRLSMSSLSPVNFPDCMDCPAIAICGGGCRYDALHSSGSIRGTRKERCEFERGFLRWMIERTVRRGRDSLIPKGGFSLESMPMPVGTMTGEDREMHS